MAMKMFEEMADKIFAEAKVQKQGNEHLWEQCVNILSMKMAELSATMGLSQQRVDVFEKQKQTLVDDLKKFKAEGKI